MDNKNHETVIEMLLTSAKMKSKNEKKDGAVWRWMKAGLAGCIMIIRKEEN